MLLAVVLILEIVDCSPVRVVNAVEVLPIVTAKPAELACIAGELDLDTLVANIDGEALLKLVIEGELLGPGEFIVAADGELWRPDVAEGELLMPGELIVTEGEWRMVEDGDARTAGEPTRLGRQCLTESDPDWESLLLLGEPGEDTITWRGRRPPAGDGPTRGESGR